MAARPDNLDTVKFTLELLRRIPRHKKVTAKEMHAQLAEAGVNRDLRTVQRQLEMLPEHFDIERDDRTRPYGYKWKEKSSGLSLPQLSTQESLLLVLAQQHLKNLLPASLLKSMDGFFDQARSLLDPLRSSERLETQWLSKVKVVSTTQPLLPPSIKSVVFEAVSNALYQNRWLDIEYKNASGKQSKTSVMPLGLAQQGERLYLVCRFYGYDNERSLAIHRIQSAVVSELKFDKPSKFDLQQYEDDGRFAIGNGKKIQLSFDINKKAGTHLLETALSRDQEAIDHGTHFRIKASVIDSPLLDRWLLSFGDDISQIEKS